MRIGMILDQAFPPDIRVENEAVSLAQNGHDVFLFCYSYSNEEKSIKYRGIHLQRVRVSRYWIKKMRALVNVIPVYEAFLKKRIKRFIIKNDIDVMHVHDLYLLGVSLKVSRELGVPVVSDLHENYVEAIKTYNWANSFTGKMLTRPRRWEKLERKYLERVAHIIVTCKEYKKVLLHKYDFLNEKNIHVHLNVPDLYEFFSYEIDKKVLGGIEGFFIFYFGVIGERRGVFTCFDALKKIERESNIKLLLIGPVDKGIASEFQSNLNDPQIKDRIIHYPWKDISLIPSYINASDICLSPLLKNGHHNTTIANKVFQYMAMGKPLVVSDCKPQQEIIEEENCGLVHEAGNVDDLAEKVMDLFNNPDLRQKMGERGRKAVMEKYNLEKERKSIIALYDSIKLNS
ncbi:MAG: glycosyltransferase family 4 protein [candidate division KSB1 bacterium]|jgi:glycosyltransferase involved in cell wall biosynthesis|nr:glycosyltransferase family 4 protein [candidate division KSB1 bacterium]